MTKHASKPKQRPLDKFLFDDCPICQAMKRAEQEGCNLDEPELRAAFRKAKEKGGTVYIAPRADDTR